MWIPVGSPAAIARIAGSNASPCLYGTLKLYCIGKSALIVADIRGLPAYSRRFSLRIDGDDAALSEASDCLPQLISCHGKAFFTLMTDEMEIDRLIGKSAVIFPSDKPDAVIADGRITAT